MTVVIIFLTIYIIFLVGKNPHHLPVSGFWDQILKINCSLCSKNKVNLHANTNWAKIYYDSWILYGSGKYQKKNIRKKLALNINCVETLNSSKFTPTWTPCVYLIFVLISILQ